MLRLSKPNIPEDAIDAAVEVLRSGQLVHGSESEAFEQELARYLGCQDVVLVSSGTAALHLALLALDIGPGDAVIVPDFTFPASANAVAMVGARVVIVDVEPGTYTISSVQLERTLKTWVGPETLRAVMPVHEFGCPADMHHISAMAKEYGISVVEDAACALGARYQGKMVGTLGNVGCFSFHPRKTLTTGEGGAISTNDQVLARRLRRLRNHGMERSDEGMRFLEPATNYRLTNFQAALGRKQLPHLDDWIAMRRELVDIYREDLLPLELAGSLRLPAVVDGHSWQTFMVTLDAGIDRLSIISTLRDCGVESNLGAQSLSEIGLYGEQLGEFSVGPCLYRSGLALPLFEQLVPDDVRRVCQALSTALRS